MQNSSKSNNDPYLNRLALLENADKDAIDPYAIVADLFNYASLAQLSDLLIKATRAALSDKYNWKGGSPGNLLYFYERTELVLEACFLILTSKRHKQRSKYSYQASNKKKLQQMQLPCSLSLAEINDPIIVIRLFFEFHSLKKWKQQLYAWMQAGLSDYTVLDTISPKNIILYHHHLQRMLDACWYIRMHYKKNTG